MSESNAKPSSTDKELSWERRVGSPQGAPTLWRTEIPEGWLVCLEGAVGNSLTLIRDPLHEWSSGTIDDDEAKEELAEEHVSVHLQKEEHEKRSDRVIASPGIGIATTEAEIAAFDVVKALTGESRLAYTDTQTYFAIHLGNPMKWIARIAFSSRESWVGFCLDEKEGKKLAAKHNIELLPPNFLSKVRVGIAHPDDLNRLAPLLEKALQKVR